MSRIFLSHSSENNDRAVALRDWLLAQGWDDVFLDLDPQRGIAAGERWERALNQAALRCEAVLFLVSWAWLSSDWCMKEFNLAHRLNKRLFGLLIEDIPIGRLPATLTGTWQLVPLASGRDHIMMRSILPGTQEEVHVTFSQEGLTRLRIGLERAGLDARFFAWPPEHDPKRPPYRGLLPLESPDAGIFFGREAPTIEALDRIRGMRDAAAPRLLVILGASGAGKSSFLRAGVMPRLVRDDQNYLALPVIRPERAAINGDAGLLRALETGFAARDLIMPRAEIRKAIEGGTPTVRTLLQKLIERSLNPAEARPPVIVLAIDQGEELFLTDGASESSSLLNHLRDLLSRDDPALLVIITIRSDAYEQLQTVKALEGLPQHPLSLAPMPRGAYQAVIEGPAFRLKETNRPLAIEPALTQALLSEIDDGGGRDALPLLAFTMERLYLEYAARGRLTLKDYDALGRIKGSIEAAVERAFRAADNDANIPHDQDARLALLRRGLIPWLAGIDPDSGNSRRQKARSSEIPEEARPLINLLVEQRLLSTDISDDTGEITIEPAHEALLRQWGALQRWLQEDFAALTNLETVKRAARDWAANANGDDWLAHRAGRLEDAERLLKRFDLAGNLGVLEHAYLVACRDAEEAARKEKTLALQRRLQLQRRLSIGTALAALIMAVVGAAAYWQKTKADQAIASAHANLVAAHEAAASAKANLEQAQANLSQANINQIRFLSRASKLSVTKGDSVTAIDLALEALDQASDRDTPYAKDVSSALYSALVEERELFIFGQHRGSIINATFSPDGNYILTASEDKARLWDVVTGRQASLFEGHHRPLTQASFSPDGTRVVTASMDSTAIVWDVESGRIISKLFHSLRTLDAIKLASFSPDGTRVVTATETGMAQVWDAESGEQVTILDERADQVNSIVFSPNGTLIVTASRDRTAKIYDAATGKRNVTLSGGHYGELTSAVFDPSGTRLLTTSSDRAAIIWDTTTGKQIAVLLGHTGRINCGAFSPNGSRIVTASDDNTARVWETSNGNQIAILQGHSDAINSATFNGSGSRVVTASKDRTARLWDAWTGRQIAILDGHAGAVNTAVFSPSGTQIVTGSSDRTARLWDASSTLPRIVLFYPLGDVTPLADGLSSNATIATWDSSDSRIIASIQGPDRAISNAAFNPDRSKVVTASKDTTARIWDAKTGAELRVLRGHDYRVKSAAYSPDGSRIVTASLDGTARIWDVSTGKQVGSLEGLESGISMSSARFSPDNTKIVTASSDNTARIWDAASGKQIVKIGGNERAEGMNSAVFSPDGSRIGGNERAEGMNSAVFSPDGSRIATASTDGTAAVWDAKTGQRISVFRDADSQFRSVAFNPDGSRIVTGLNDNTARVWDVARAKEIAVITGHESVVNSAEFSPDGASIITASQDETARLWNAATGEQLAILRGHDDLINSASFGSDGKTVVTASEDGTARSWTIASNIDQLVSLAKSSVPRCLAREQRKEYFLQEAFPGWCYDMKKWPLRPLSDGQ
jgi:WD40 repeat protein